MKIAIAVNHSWPHVGGSETVTRQIAEGLVRKCGFECTIFSATTKTSFEHNGVKYRNCHNNHLHFLKEVNGNFDRLLIYSDLFVHWPRIIHNLSAVKCPVILAPVGMNAALSKSMIMSKLKKQKGNLKFIIHTRGYRDHKMLEDINVDPYYIPNAIDLLEFDECEYVDVFSKYNITNRNINLLNVSNFFPNKGQDLLPLCLKGLESKVNTILISSAQSYSLNNQLRSATKRAFESSGINGIFLEEIPRNDIINFYKQSDIFVFPSLIESFGIVPMESMAAKTPWVSFPVGNMKNFEGGKIVNANLGFEANGKIKVSNESLQSFGTAIFELINDDNLRKQLANKGRKQIEQEYSLNVIINKYKEVICG